MFNDFSSLVLVGSSVEGASGVEHLIEIGYFLPRKEGIINKLTFPQLLYSTAAG